MRGGYAIQLTDKFERDYKALPPDIRERADACIRDLGQEPLPPGRRMHSVTPRGQKPTIYTVDVTANKAYKLSFHLQGNVAVLRRVADHRTLDRAP
jgi:mRNA-degrading endonuclease RelE of RelBE toxin-antitoxin system